MKFQTAGGTASFMMLVPLMVVRVKTTDLLKRM
jgi:hypothetical protein